MAILQPLPSPKEPIAGGGGILTTRWRAWLQRLDVYLRWLIDGGTNPNAMGTFTPTVQIGGASTGITYTTQYGRWTRFGNRYLIDGGVLLSSKGALTGAVSIAGLPATPAVNVPVTMSGTAIVLGSGLSLLGETSGAVVYPLSLTPSTGVVATISNSQITDATSFKFSAQFTV